MENTLEKTNGEIENQTETTEVAKEPSSIDKEIDRLYLESNEINAKYGKDPIADEIIDLIADIVRSWQKMRDLVNEKIALPDNAGVEKDALTGEINNYLNWVQHQHGEIAKLEEKLPKK